MSIFLLLVIANVYLVLKKKFNFENVKGEISKFKHQIICYFHNTFFEFAFYIF